MRPIDADALKEFIDNCQVCDICPYKKIGCADSCDFPDRLTPLWEKVIDNAPTIDDLSEYSDKLWKLAYERGKAEARPKGEWSNESKDSLLCSACGKRVYKPFIGGFPTERTQHYYPNFCAFCGADMRGEEV
jgi:hypothetical protein